MKERGKREEKDMSIVIPAVMEQAWYVVYWHKVLYGMEVSKFRTLLYLVRNV